VSKLLRGLPSHTFESELDKAVAGLDEEFTPFGDAFVAKQAGD
jgi:hypothetical protein